MPRKAKNAGLPPHHAQHLRVVGTPFSPALQRLQITGLAIESDRLWHPRIQRSYPVSYRKLQAFEDLRRRAGSPSLESMGTWSTSGPDSNRRRSQRVILSVPVSVSGQAAKGQFTEDTKTLVVNAHGALITLAAKVSQGQQLELKSVSNPEPQTCKVVYIGPTVQGQTQVGIEFTKPAPHFWHVAFPPENWTPVADEGAASKTPASATKPAGPAGTKSPVTAPAKPVATGTSKPPVPAPVKVSKP